MVRRKAVSDESSILRELRNICLELPETIEAASWGNPTFKAGKKSFVVLDQYHGELCICFSLPVERKRGLLKNDMFFNPPYIGNTGWIAMKVGGKALDRRLVKELAIESYRSVALERMLKELVSA